MEQRGIFLSSNNQYLSPLPANTVSKTVQYQQMFCSIIKFSVSSLAQHWPATRPALLYWGLVRCKRSKTEPAAIIWVFPQKAVLTGSRELYDRFQISSLSRLSWSWSLLLLPRWPQVLSPSPPRPPLSSGLSELNTYNWTHSHHRLPSQLWPAPC